jgi:hypothetical protein
MKQCLDQDDFINKIKDKYELDEFQESQLRTAYQKATEEEQEAGTQGRHRGAGAHRGLRRDHPQPHRLHHKL